MIEGAEGVDHITCNTYKHTRGSCPCMVQNSYPQFSQPQSYTFLINYAKTKVRKESNQGYTYKLKPTCDFTRS